MAEKQFYVTQGRVSLAVGDTRRCYCITSYPRMSKRIAFNGSYQECLDFIKDEFAKSTRVERDSNQLELGLYRVETAEG
jgi:hypothetical protein